MSLLALGVFLLIPDLVSLDTSSVIVMSSYHPAFFFSLFTVHEPTGIQDITPRLPQGC